MRCAGDRWVSVPLRRHFPAVALAVAVALGTGLLGVPWPHALLAGISVVSFRLAIEALPAFRPGPALPPPAQAVPAPPASLAAQVPPVGPRSDHPIVRGPGGTLTRRELEAALLLAEGLTNKEIGERMFREESTVDTHLANVRTKLDAHNRAQIVAILAEHGLIPSGRRRP